MSTNMSERKSAEEYIANIETTNGYSTLLLSMIVGEVGSGVVTENIKLPLILTLKNYFKKNYKLDERDNLLNIPENDVETIRRNIINVSLNLSSNLSCHMDEIIGIIAKKDFPQNWPLFLQEIISIINTLDIDKCIRFLKIIHKAFKKYRYEFKSNELWIEIKYVIELFGPIFINLLNYAQNNMPLLVASPIDFLKNKNDSLKCVQFVSVLMDCYHDLISQEIPDYFVDNLDTCMKFIYNILSSETLDVNINDNENSLKKCIIKLKTRLIYLLLLFVKSYEDDIKNYLPGYIEMVYKLSLIIPKTEEYDKLNIAVIRFFSIISQRPYSKIMISDINTIVNICANIIIPNAYLRECEIEIFEDEPLEYISRDIESADMETKRQAVTELIRQLIQSYGDSVVTTLNNHIDKIMKNSFFYDETNQIVKIGSDWLAIDLAIYLIISSAIIRESARVGPITICPSFDINLIFNRFIAPLLLFVGCSEYPILKADTLKYIHIFRNFINPISIENILPNILNHLAGSNSKVVISYVFIVVGNLLTNYTLDNKLMPQEEIDHRQQVLLSNFNNFHKYFVPTQNDNIYQIKWLIKWLNYFNVNVSVDFLQIIAERLISLVDSFDKSNINPEFIHQSFEALCLILWLCKCINHVQLEDTEMRLLNVTINQIVQNNSNINGYMLQIYSLFLKLFSKEKFSSVYIQNYSIFLSQELWMCKSNVPGLCHIMNSYLIQFSHLYTSQPSIRTVIDLFKYCLTLNHMDGMSVSLAKNIVINLPYESMKPYISEIMSLCFKRIAIRRTYRFTQDLISFVFQFVAVHGLDEFRIILDSLDQNLFGRFINRILMLEISKPIHNLLFKKLLVTLSLIILEQSLNSLIISDPNLWWSFFKCTLESLTHNKTLLAIDNVLQDHPNEIDTTDHVIEDESFNKLTYAFVSKLPFSGAVCSVGSRSISASILHKYDLKPIIQNIFNNSVVNSQVMKHVNNDIIQQIHIQLLSPN